MVFQEQVQHYCDTITALTGVKCTLLDATEKNFASRFDVLVPYMSKEAVRQNRYISRAVRKPSDGTGITCIIVLMALLFLQRYCVNRDYSVNMP